MKMTVKLLMMRKMSKSSSRTGEKMKTCQNCKYAIEQEELKCYYCSINEEDVDFFERCDKWSDKMEELQTTYCKCNRNCLCSECEDRVADYPITFRGEFMEVTRHKGYKCSRYHVYSTCATLKDVPVLIDDVVTGELAEENIRITLKYITEEQLENQEVSARYI